jgi:hypothetical protein
MITKNKLTFACSLSLELLMKLMSLKYSFIATVENLFYFDKIRFRFKLIFLALKYDPRLLIYSHVHHSTTIW